jgi:DNA binding domain, excisionase family
MYKATDFTKNIYKMKDISNFIGVTTITLKNWERKGLITFDKTEKGTRYLTKENLIKLLKEKRMYNDELDILNKKDVIYCRVSSQDQKQHGDLDRQVSFIINSCKDLVNPIVLSEVGSGLNDKRKKLQQLLKMVLNNEVSRIFITYEDRLTRFGFEYLKTMCEAHNTKIVVIKDIDVVKSIEQELMEDIMSLMASFNDKLYEMRSKGKNNEKRN